MLRDAVRAASDFDETIKSGHLVYLSNDPVLLIRAEEERVLLVFWRGKRLPTIEPCLKSGGKYEMATLELRKGMTIDAGTVSPSPPKRLRSTRRSAIRRSDCKQLLTAETHGG